MKNTFSLFVLVSCLCMSELVFAACVNPNIETTKPDGIYTDHGNGTITDHETNLMWQKCSLGQAWDSGAGESTSCYFNAETYTWQAALYAATGNSLNGYDDWRLPNKNELESLLEDACWNPAINETVFPNTVAERYWSSTPYADYPRSAWMVYFIYDDLGQSLNSSVNSHDKNGSFYVRLVRDAG